MRMRYTPPNPVLETLETLRNAGYPAYLVGGCVRDDIIGIRPHDYDICSAATPDDVRACFPNKRVLDTGARHGTVTLLTGGMQLEITTFRVDGEYTDARHPDSVAYTDDITRDLSRRDFTMNAIAWSPATGFVDPFDGRGDIACGRIKCVGDPAQRFSEDALRILRGVRFAAQFGFRIDGETKRAMNDMREQIKRLSAERVAGEMTRLLASEYAAHALAVHADIVFSALPELEPMRPCPQRNVFNCQTVWTHTLHTVKNTPARALVRWAALLHDVGKPSGYGYIPSFGDAFYWHPERGEKIARALLTRLKMSNADIKYITALCLYHDAPVKPRSVVRYLALLGRTGLEDWFALKRADIIAHAPNVWPRLISVEDTRLAARLALESGACLSAADLHIDGDALKALGCRGRDIGDCVRQLLGLVQDGIVKNEADALARAAHAECFFGKPYETLFQSYREQGKLRVLDMGCGNGQRALWLARRGFTVTASDTLPEAMQALREQEKREGLTIRAVHLKDGALPFAADAFDIVLLRDHMPLDPSELKRVLRPGGAALRGTQVVYTSEKTAAAPIDQSAVGKRVHIVMDRPLGSTHPSHIDLVYPVNYGYVPGMRGGDGADQDVYLLGVREAVSECDAVVRAIFHRYNDREDKWIALPEGVEMSDDEMLDAIAFTERYFDGVLLR